MRWGIACLAAIALSGAALGDTVGLRAGRELRGTLRDLTFSSNGIKLTYPREDVISLALGEKADKLELHGEVTMDGRLVSLTFQTTLGIRTLLRDQLKAFALDSATTLDAIQAAKAEEELKAQGNRPELTDEQLGALKLNYKLYKDYLKKADEQKDKDLEAIKAKYNAKVRQIVTRIDSLQRQIEAKLRRRREANLHGTTYREYGSSTGRIETEYERLRRTDGLERDQRELQKSWQQAIGLKKTIRAQQRKVLDKKEATGKRLRALGLRHKKTILQGKVPSEEQMTASYEAVLTGAAAQKKKAN